MVESDGSGCEVDCVCGIFWECVWCGSGSEEDGWFSKNMFSCVSSSNEGLGCC